MCLILGSIVSEYILLSIFRVVLVRTGARDFSKCVKLVSLVHARGGNPDGVRFRTACVLSHKAVPHFAKQSARGQTACQLEHFLIVGHRGIRGVGISASGRRGVGRVGSSVSGRRGAGFGLFGFLCTTITV